jgi:hypothetical protein
MHVFNCLTYGFLGSHHTLQVYLYTQPRELQDVYEDEVM